MPDVKRDEQKPGSPIPATTLVTGSLRPRKSSVEAAVPAATSIGMQAARLPLQKTKAPRRGGAL